MVCVALGDVLLPEKESSGVGTRYLEGRALLIRVMLAGSPGWVLRVAEEMGIFP
jgi:hypothetical protein